MKGQQKAGRVEVGASAWKAEYDFLTHMREAATDSEQVYSPNLEAAFRFILEHPLISDSPGSQSSSL